MTCAKNSENMLSLVLDVLRERRLCDRCLGRLFSSYLRGFTNRERGEALKLALVMGILFSGDVEKLRLLQGKLEDRFRETFEKAGLEWKEPEKCWLCEDKIERWIELYRDAVEKLLDVRADSFVVGVKAPAELLRKEDELWRKHCITSAESIRSELRREVGKRIKEEMGIEPDFEEPGVNVLLDLEEERVETQVNPLLLRGKYLKLGRNISQTRWVTRDGRKVYELSVEEMLEEINRYYKGEKIILHASGREDTDARMLGTGRPMVVEVKNPTTRRAPVELLNYLLNKNNQWARFTLCSKASRKEVRQIKTSDALRRKVYKALVLSHSPVTREELVRLEEFFRDREVAQRTPLRVLHRRSDLVRRKRVFQTRTVQFTDHIFEAIIEAEGGLYIKELISGDQGRTIPSFSNVIGKELECVELDVLSVEEWVTRLQATL